ncbi:MAG: sigma-70 family RNA polymerase sigma factor [Planctomycetota bacterium]
MPGSDDTSRAGDPTPEELTPTRVGSLLEDYRARLQRMVDLRMDPHVRARIDSSDVIQEAYAEVLHRLPAYRNSPDMPFFLWVRFITGQKLLQAHRHHLGAQERDPRREVGILGGVPDMSSVMLASVIADSGLLSPSQAIVKEEQAERLKVALDQLKPIDREVIVLRHFEHLTNSEIAQVLGLKESGATLRYTRALKRLSEILGQA